MTRPYLILVNGVLADRHMTRAGAMKHIASLAIKGVKAVIAYDVSK